ncbi:MAG: hypothetical protein ACI8WB_003836 [Phenylobacterium sp.]|jgi:hypothetical protein
MKIESSQITATNQHQSQFLSHQQVTVVKPGTPNITNRQGEDIRPGNRQNNIDNPNRGARPSNTLNNALNNTLNSTLNSPANNAQANAIANLQRLSQDTVDISSLKTQGGTAKTDTNSIEKALEESTYYDKGLFIMKMLLEKMSGKPIELFNASDFMNDKNAIETNAAALSQNPTGGGDPNELVRVEQYTFESQSNQVAFSGSITLEDGSQSHFEFGISFSQQHESLSVEVLRREQLKDPLVISFTGKPVSLADKRFDFDIDADNQKDNIAMLDRGQGFLALDRNKDGEINNGTELFGALSGNGFADLAAFDEDNNGFIDENDSVFSELSVWIKNEGEDRLISLQEAKIGAIALQNVNSPFTIRNSDDETTGIIRKSGFYLDDKGTPGLIQQLDFVV